jgi:ABC-type bacteriocin/lantibiotic exporter with double-glycine peptidase domain
MGWKGLLLSLLTSLFFLSCTAVTAPNNHFKKAQIIENVPFYPQEMFQCGPASLAEIFNFWGTKISPEEIAGEIYSKSARGTLTIDMVFYAEKKGFAARQYSGNLLDVQTKIDSGYPLVVLVDYGFSIYEKTHYMVILGYNEDGLLVHSGKEKGKFIPLKPFIKAWEKTNFWTLLIGPKGDEK